MKGQNELIIAVAVVLIVITVVTLMFLNPFESPVGQAVVQQTITLNPVHDGYINEDGWNIPAIYTVFENNFLTVSNGAFDDPIENRIFLRFDLTGITGVSSANLNLIKIYGGSTYNCPELYKISDYYPLGQEDWSTSGQLITALPCNGSATVNIPLNYINENTINAFMIKGNYRTDEIRYDSMESTNKPYLALQAPITIPNPPTGLTAVPGPGTGQVTLNWNPVTGADNYAIVWSTPQYGNFVIQNITNTSYIHTTTVLPSEGQIHYYEILACNTAGCTNFTNFSNGVTAYPMIGANSGGAYSGTANIPITLYGTAEYAIGNPTYSWNITGTANCTPANSTQQNPTITCSSGGTATAELTVNADNGTAINSSTITITGTVPDIPTGLTAVPGSNPGEILLNWNAVLGAEYYEISDIDPRQPPCQAGCTYPTTTNTSYIFAFGAEPASLKYFRVAACSSDGCSDYSSPYIDSYPKIGADAGGLYLETPGTGFNLNGNALFEVGTTTYSWNITGTANCTPTSSTQQNPIITCSTIGGTATAALTVNAYNGTETDLATITITAGPTLDTPIIASSGPGPNTGEMTLTWNPVLNADYYTVGMALEPANLVLFDVTGTTFTYTQSAALGSTWGYEHPFTVSARNNAGEYSNNSELVYIYPKLGVTLNGFSAYVNQPILINAIVEYPAQYPSPTYSWTIYKNTGTPDCTLLTSSQPSFTTTCNSLETNKVLLDFTAGNGVFSGEVNLLVENAQGSPPNQPINVSAGTGTQPGQINVSWTDGGGTQTEYFKIYITPFGEAIEEYQTANANELSHTYTTTTPSTNGIIHSIGVQACNSNGCSLIAPNPELDVYPKIGMQINGPYSVETNVLLELSAVLEYVNQDGTEAYLWEITENNSTCTLTNSTDINSNITCTQETGSGSPTTVKLTLTANQGDNAINTTTITVIPEADTSNPTINITQPTENSIVSATVTISADAADPESGIRNVKFFVDDALKSTDTTAPYEYAWSTANTSNGNHTIKAKAENTFGLTEQHYIIVHVNNSSSGPVCGNNIIEAGEDCESDSQCASQTTCDYSNKRFGTKNSTCSNCSCVEGNWIYTLRNSSVYCLKCNSCLDSEEGNCNEDCGDSTPPSKPTGLETASTTTDSIAILWNSNTETDLKKYTIYYGTISGNYSKETIALPNETSTTIENLDSDTTYFIAVKAVDNGGNSSDYSDEVNAKTKEEQTVLKPKKPAGLTAEYTEGKVKLEWIHTSPKPDYYIIQRKIKENSFSKIKTTSDNSYNDEEITKGKTYVYRVAGFKDGKRSDYSDESKIEIQKELNCKEDSKCNEECENDLDCKKETDLIPWGIGTAIMLVSAALAYIFFTVDI